MFFYCRSRNSKKYVIKKYIHLLVHAIRSFYILSWHLIRSHILNLLLKLFVLIVSVHGVVLYWKKQKTSRLKHCLSFVNACLTFNVTQLELMLACSLRCLIEDVVGVIETLLPKDDSMFLFLDGVLLLKERARPTLNLVRAASRIAFDNVPVPWLAPLISIPIS